MNLATMGYLVSPGTAMICYINNAASEKENKLQIKFKGYIKYMRELGNLNLIYSIYS
jgi:hypothetical protein